MTPTLHQVKQAAAAHFGFSLRQLDANRRDKSLVLARQVAMTVAKRQTLASLPQIGRAFAGRDHTTVMHAVRKIEQLARTDAAIAVDLDAIAREAVHMPLLPDVDHFEPEAGAEPTEEHRAEAAGAGWAEIGDLLVAVAALEQLRFSPFEARAITTVISAGREARRAVAERLT